MIKVILFDFDGVILDSMPIKEYGFKKIFEKFKPKAVEKLIIYHNENGGLSRFVKIRYFFNTILNQNIEEVTVQEYANQFSAIMRQELIKSKYLIPDTINFIYKKYKNKVLHIVSGSENFELRYLCHKLGISHYFKSIQGSPTPKIEIIKKLLAEFGYNSKEICFIGDSINDFEAAHQNGIMFFGYNNLKLKHLPCVYLESLKNDFF